SDSSSISSPSITCGCRPASRWSGGTPPPPSGSPDGARRSRGGGGPCFGFFPRPARAGSGPAPGPAARARPGGEPGPPRPPGASAGAGGLALAGTGPALLARADELDALLRLSLGDLRSAAGLAGGLPAGRRSMLLARIALATGDHHTAQEHLRALPPGGLTPR